MTRDELTDRRAAKLAGETPATLPRVPERDRFGYGEECSCGCGATSAPVGLCECGKPKGHS